MARVYSAKRHRLYDKLFDAFAAVPPYYDDFGRRQPTQRVRIKNKSSRSPSSSPRPRRSPNGTKSNDNDDETLSVVTVRPTAFETDDDFESVDDPWNNKGNGNGIGNGSADDDATLPVVVGEGNSGQTPLPVPMPLPLPAPAPAPQGTPGKNVWQPDPRAMPDDGFEASVRSFYRKRNPRRLGKVRSLIATYKRNRGRLFDKLWDSFQAVPDFVDSDGNTIPTKLASPHSPTSNGYGGAMGPISIEMTDKPRSRRRHTVTL